MSYANGTQFYNLPQTVGTDKRDWFDTNAPFAAIDAALHAAVVGQAADAEAISTINSKLATDEADIAALQTKTTTHDSQIAALQTTVNTQASQIQDVRQDAEDMITANNEGAAATSTRAYGIGDYFIYNDVLYKATAAIDIGDTIVPNTNCEATNVDTELTQLNSELGGRFISVTADGVKTISALLSELLTLVDNTLGLSSPEFYKNVMTSKLYVNNRVFNCSFEYGMFYTLAEASETQMSVSTIAFNGSNPPLYKTSIINNQGQFNAVDNSNIVLSAGAKVSFIY